MIDKIELQLSILKSKYMSEVRGKSTLQYFHVRYKMDGNNGKKENKWGLKSLTSSFHRQRKYYLSAAKMYLLFLRNMALTCKGQEMVKSGH